MLILWYWLQLPIYLFIICFCSLLAFYTHTHTHTHMLYSTHCCLLSNHANTVAHINQFLLVSWMFNPKTSEFPCEVLEPVQLRIPVLVPVDPCQFLVLVWHTFLTTHPRFDPLLSRHLLFSILHAVSTHFLQRIPTKT